MSRVIGEQLVVALQYGLAASFYVFQVRTLWQPIQVEPPGWQLSIVAPVVLGTFPEVSKIFSDNSDVRTNAAVSLAIVLAVILVLLALMWRGNYYFMNRPLVVRHLARWTPSLRALLLLVGLAGLLFVGVLDIKDASISP